MLSNGTAVKLSADNNWTATVEDLPKFKDGVEITYTWAEDEIEGYIPVSSVTDGTVTTLTNRHDIATQEVTVVKVWDDDNNRDGLRPESLTVTLNAAQSVVLNDENHWTATIADQPVYANGGREIIYRWIEDKIQGYHLTKRTEGTTTTLVNTHNPETVDITVVKVWDDANNQDGLRPATLTLTLLADGAVQQTVTLTESSGWSATVESLPIRNDGRAIVYAWAEPEIEGYVSASAVNGATTTITNTHVPATVTCKVTKVWADNNDEDGLRPTSLAVTLNADGKAVRTVTLSAANRWTAMVPDLPVYANGAAISYTWTEASIPGYKRTGNNTVPAEDGVIATTITNTHDHESIDLTVTKVWEDTDTVDRPASVNMVLVGSNGDTRLVTLSAANAWTSTVTGLARYSDGKAVTYIWMEPSIPGYTQTDVVTTGTTTVFTNTRNLPVAPSTEYTLTVNYLYLDGSIAAPTYTGIYREGDPYEVVSPVIAGYKATLLRVTGMMPASDLVYTVIYLPADGPTIIEKTEIPWIHGPVYINIGDCLE